MIRCLHCNAETSNGLALCDLCQRLGSTRLEFLPIYFHNLARWRPGRAGSRPVPGSRVLYDGHVSNGGTGDRISDTLDETANMLTTRARMLVDDRPHLGRLLDRLAAARRAERVTEAQAVAWLCAGFTRYLTSISTLDWCGDFVGELGHHEARLRALTETVVLGWYAGGCKQPGCEVGIYVVPGLTWVTCGGCGATTHAPDHIETVLEEARDWVATPKRLAEAIVAMVHTEQSVEDLRKRIAIWGERGHLEIYRQHDYAIKRYQFGEVLDVTLARQKTRPSVAVDAAADAS